MAVVLLPHLQHFQPLALPRMFAGREVSIEVPSQAKSIKVALEVLRDDCCARAGKISFLGICLLMASVRSYIDGVDALVDVDGTNVVPSLSSSRCSTNLERRVDDDCALLVIALLEPRFCRAIDSVMAEFWRAMAEV